MNESQAVVVFAALAQETRLKIIRLLVEFGSEGLNAGRLAEELGVAPSNLSFHVKELQNAGLITSKRQGKMVNYSLSFEMLSSIGSFLTDNCCQRG